MSYNGQNTQRARVTKVVEVKDKHSVVHLSTSRKYKDKYLYSAWFYCSFVGDAHTLFRELNIGKGDVLVLKNSMMTWEEYEKNGETLRPKSPSLVVFDFDVYRKGGSTQSTKPPVEEEDEDDIPF